MGCQTNSRLSMNFLSMKSEEYGEIHSNEYVIPKPEEWCIVHSDIYYAAVEKHIIVPFLHHLLLLYVLPLLLRRGWWDMFRLDAWCRYVSELKLSRGCDKFSTSTPHRHTSPDILFPEVYHQHSKVDRACATRCLDNDASECLNVRLICTRLCMFLTNKFISFF